MNETKVERVIGSDAARAVGRFRKDGPSGYRAATMPNAPLRATRHEAVGDELAWLERAPVTDLLSAAGASGPVGRATK